MIDDFSPTSPYHFLSNFYVSTFYIEGKPYSSVEHAFQAHKATDPTTRELIRKASTPWEAKRLARSLPPREDWDSVKLDLMRSFLKLKFENPFLRPLLIETKDAELVFRNKWSDTYFGVCRDVGQNWLGKLLMELREEIANEHVADELK